MASGEEENKQLSIVFERDKNAPTIPVSGVWGGPTADGSSLHAHMYLEYASIPNIINTSIDKEGKIGDPNAGERITRGEITREIQATIVMSPEQAKSIGQWLISTAEKIESQKR